MDALDAFGDRLFHQTDLFENSIWPRDCMTWILMNPKHLPHRQRQKYDCFKIYGTSITPFPGSMLVSDSEDLRFIGPSTMCKASAGYQRE